MNHRNISTAATATAAAALAGPSAASRPRVYPARAHAGTRPPVSTMAMAAADASANSSVELSKQFLQTLRSLRRSASALNNGVSGSLNSAARAFTHDSALATPPPSSDDDTQLNESSSIDRQDVVRGLVHVAAVIVDHIWSPNKEVETRGGLSTRDFIQEILRRSKTSFSTLQLALFYLIRLRTQKQQSPSISSQNSLISDIVEETMPAETASMSVAPLSPDQQQDDQAFQKAELWGAVTSRNGLSNSLAPNNSAEANQPAADASTNPSYPYGLDNPRRAFLAALILSSKYLHDRTYSARAWSDICGLPLAEVVAAERNMLNAIDHRLHVRREAFQVFSGRLVKKAVEIAKRAAIANSVGISSSVPVEIKTGRKRNHEDAGAEVFGDALAPKRARVC